MSYNIILVMTDELRTDHVGFLDDSRIRTPNIDALAQSVAFSKCITTSPVCTPARTSLLTGKYPHQVGMLAMSGDLSRQHPTYLRALQDAGYWTAGVGKFHWLQGYPFSPKEYKGFDLVALRNEIKRYGLDYVWEASGKQLAANHDLCDYAAHLKSRGVHEQYQRHVKSRTYRSGPDRELGLEDGDPWPLDESDYVDIVTGNEVLAALDARPADRPFFLFASFCGPHPPNDPPASALEEFSDEEVEDAVLGDHPLSEEEERAIRKIRRSYKAMVRVIDNQIGRLLDRLETDGLLDKTVILFTSDHGEMLGDHHLVGKQVPYAKSVTVPTAIRHPEFLERKTCATPVELIDLTATILDIAGIDPQEALSKPWPVFHDRVPCRSLMPIVRGETDRVRDFAFSEHVGWQMIQDGRYKYARYWASSLEEPAVETLFDTVSDPDELTDVAGDDRYAGDLARLGDLLRRVLDTTPAAQLRWAPTMRHPEEEILC